MSTNHRSFKAVLFSPRFLRNPTKSRRSGDDAKMLMSRSLKRRFDIIFLLLLLSGITREKKEPFDLDFFLFFVFVFVFVFWIWIWIFFFYFFVFLFRDYTHTHTQIQTQSVTLKRGQTRGETILWGKRLFKQED